MKKNQIQTNLGKNLLLDNYERFRIIVINYSDLVIRGLIAFFGIGVLFYLLLVGYMHIKPIYVLPLVFIASIIVSPFLSRVHLAERIFTKYELWLQSLFKK